MPSLGLKMGIGSITSLIAQVYATGLQMWLKVQNYLTEDGSTDRLPDSGTAGTNTGALFTGRGLSFTTNDSVDFGDLSQTVKSVVFYVYPDTTTEEFLELQASGAVVVAASSGTLVTTGWTSPTTYVNGASGSTVTATTWQQVGISSATGIDANAVKFGINNATYGDCDLSNVKFFDIELSSAQFAELYANPEQAVPTGVSISNLVFYTPLADGVVGQTPEIVLDISGNENNGTPAGPTQIGAIGAPAPQLALKGYNTPMWFDKVNDSVNGTADAGGTEGTFIGTVISDIDQGASYGYIFSIGPNTASAGSIFGIARHADISGDENKLYVYDGSGIQVSAQILAQNTKYQIAVSYSGTSVKVYIDGSFLEELTMSNSINVATLTYYLGRLGLTVSPNWFSGLILEGAFWNKELSAQNISDISNGVSPTSIEAVNLQFWYKNTGNTSADWVDLSGNGNDGTVNGSPAKLYIPEGLTSGQDGLGQDLTNSNTGEMLLDGTGYGLVSDAASLDITDELTLMAWVKPFSVSVAQTVIGKTGAYQLEITSGAKPSFSKWTSTSETATATTSTTVTADVWTHIAATYDGVNVRLYVNGEIDTTTAVSGAIDTNANDVLIGALSAGSEEFDGYIDEPMIYDTLVLTDAQVKGNYNATKGSHTN